ncbi:MAG: hypothetical protein KBT88_06080 [Gammaproteobacteria bacterium]|nr:hypothetical protein [Gammaproteobacteria bacterium]MBQ0839336.1 hypothetical protein [Gammaproteobacteria bacterium]
MKHAYIKKIAQTLVGSSLLFGAATFADELCTNGYAVPVKGTIINNGQAPDAGFSTLGVVKLRVGKRPHVLARMKCGIVGVSAATEAEPFAFTHTLSCNDDNAVYLGAELGLQNAHSQLTLDTHGDLTVEGSCAPITNGIYGSFIEYSSPSPDNTGRGLFTGVTEGELTIEGDINCLGSIDMSFEGYVCLIPQ